MPSMVDPARERALREFLAAGMNPNKAARAAGVSKTFAYNLDRGTRGVSRLAERRAAGRPAPAARRTRGLPPERVRAVLDGLASGMNPLRAAAAAGVSKSFAYELAKKMGGVCRPQGTEYCERYLNRDERYEIARLKGSGLSIRAIGAQMGRPASTICRELARNAEPRSGNYQPERAHRLAWERQRRPKASRLSRNAALRAEVQGKLDLRHSPEQISGRLKVKYPGDPGMHISHETVYQSIYVYPRGELKKELKASLRSGRVIRYRRGRKQKRSRIVDAVPIGQRPAEAEGRLVPGHHEGDLIMGTKASNSAVGTIVERTTGYLTLLPLAGHDAATVGDAVITGMSAMPDWFAKSLTWDRGTELAQHKRITAATGISIYFADPHAPWQRGSNENTNGLIREYLPKGTDLSIHTPAQLREIENALNDRPRKRLGYRTPREEYARLLIEKESVATTP